MTPEEEKKKVIAEIMENLEIIKRNMKGQDEEL